MDKKELKVATIGKHRQGKPPIRQTGYLSKTVMNWITAPQKRETWKGLEDTYVEQWTEMG